MEIENSRLLNKLKGSNDARHEQDEKLLKLKV